MNNNIPTGYEDYVNTYFEEDEEDEEDQDLFYLEDQNEN